MVSFWDILIELFLEGLFLCSSLLILVGGSYPSSFFWVIIPFAAYFFIHYTLKGRKKIAKYVKADFEKLGYEIISERPLKWKEYDDAQIKLAPLMINNMPASRFGYIRQFERIFIVKNTNGELYELRALVTKEWTGENTTLIKGKKLIKPEFNKLV